MIMLRRPIAPIAILLSLILAAAPGWADGPQT
jgi:hypothetical protein